MKKRLLLYLLSFLVCFYINAPLKAQTECCDQPSCKSKAHELATAMGNSVKPLGAYPPGQAIDEIAKKKFIESLKVDYPKTYDDIIKAAKNIQSWSSQDVSRRACLADEYANLSSDELKWINYFLTSFFSSSFHSPEFAKGVGIHFHAGTGVKKLFAHTEGFVSTIGALISYTFTPKGEVTGGHTRIMIGPSLYYSHRKTTLLINPRAEFRIGDIGNEMTNIGCIKLIAQGNFGNKIQMAGAGLAAEISKFNVEFTGDYNFNNRGFILQASLGYSIFFKKNKSR